MMDGNTYDVKNLSAILNLLLGYWQSILENAIMQNVLDKTRITWRNEMECNVHRICFLLWDARICVNLPHYNARQY